MEHANKSEKTWQWEDALQLQSDPSFDISNCLLDELNENGKDPWYMFDDETTPIKGYTGLDSSVSAVASEVVFDKSVADFKGFSSQFKRRRMLQFCSSEVDTCISDGKMPSGFFKSKNMMEVPTASNNGNSCLSNTNREERTRTSIIPVEKCGNSEGERVAPSSHEWMVDCFHEPELHKNSNDINLASASVEQFDVSEFRTVPPENEMAAPKDSTPQAPSTYLQTEIEMAAPKESTPQAPSTYFAGAVSFTKTSTKASTSVAYPFSLIKPSGIKGDVTLNDINRRISATLASKEAETKQKKNEDAAPSCPSSFSGKPIVSMTKIHTVGGKGSITIMRTKG